MYWLLKVANGVNNRLKTMPVEFSVALNDLAPGKYNCQVSILDPEGRKPAFWRTHRYRAVIRVRILLSSCYTRLHGRSWEHAKVSCSKGIEENRGEKSGNSGTARVRNYTIAL